MLSSDMQYQPNQLIRDEYGRVKGVVAVNKPAGITSHDVVDEARKVLRTKKIGHAGALDPFASGVLVLLVGKATKLADTLLHAYKAYSADILFGIKTDSADPEGEILTVNPEVAISEQNLQNVLTSFSPGYEQYVPIYSSAKVNGQKLRVLARQADKHEVHDTNTGRQVTFYTDKDQQTIDIPRHYCELPQLKLQSLQKASLQNTEFIEKLDINSNTTWPQAKVDITCSKGTYIRTLAEDIGKALNPPVPAMLWQLQRTRVGEVTLEDAVELDELGTL